MRRAADAGGGLGEPPLDAPPLEAILLHLRVAGRGGGVRAGGGGGGGKEGGAYAACLSAEKARKPGPKGRAAFVRRKRAAQKKAGDAKKGKQRSKGKKPTYTKTGA